MKKNIFLVWILALLSCLLVLILFHVSSSAHTFSSATKIFIFNPYTKKCGLKSEFIIITRAPSGDCKAQSEANKGRSSALRCIASTLTLDPCFPDEKVISCFVSPWNKRVVVIEVPQPLPKKPLTINTSQMPWAIELSNGSRCSFLAGQDMNIRDLRVNYSCTHGLYIVGDIDQSRSLWSAKIYHPKTESFTQMSVVNAWY